MLDESQNEAQTQAHSAESAAANFRPGVDFPPHGAQVRTLHFVATYRDDRALSGWHLTDGRYARPFDALGHLLAQTWAHRPRMEGQGDA